MGFNGGVKGREKHPWLEVTLNKHPKKGWKAFRLVGCFCKGKGLEEDIKMAVWKILGGE